MKYIIIIITISLLVFSCKEKCDPQIRVLTEIEKKINDLDTMKNAECKIMQGIKKYIQQHFHDPEAYIPLKFGDFFKNKEGKEFTIVHRLRGKNANGNRVVKTYKFTLTRDFKVVSAEDGWSFTDEIGND